MRSTSDTDGARAFGRFSLAAFAGLVVATPAAAAPSAADAALAETLFREGKDLMAGRQFDLACPKLAESNRLDPASGTLLALALCHEGGGRLATAWVEFTDVLAATGEARPDRALLAREHIAEIEPELSRLTVIVPAALGGAPGLEVLRDGVRLDRSAWGTSFPIDGGAHTLEARAPARRTWTVHLDVAPSRDRRVVEVPTLESDAATLPVSTERAAPIAGKGPDVARLRWGVAASALGVIGLGTGAYFGVTAISKIHDAKAQCPTAPACTTQAPVTLNEDGSRDATIADVAIGVGVVAGAVGLFLVLTGRARAVGSYRIAPSFGRFGGALEVARSF